MLPKTTHFSRGKPLKVLMIYPKYPEATFWNANHSQWKFERRKANLPPLGLLTLASYLPEDFEIKLVDRNVREETAEEWRWADVVFFSLMGIQQEDYRRCLKRAREYHVPVAVGGPYTHAFPEEARQEADWVCFGEAESIMDTFLADLRAQSKGKEYDGGNKTDMNSVKLPRYDLLENIQDYGAMALQFSRGCPFMCEFCDIIEIYGRVPRTKSPEQVIAELSFIKKLGYRGYIFIVDDNFIGNKKKAVAMLQSLAKWNREQDHAYKLYTEASLNLADEPALMEAMAEANMLVVFIGIETADPKLLKTTQKTQNIPGDQLEKLQRIRSYGIHVTAGFIVGFDGETSEVFLAQKNFIQNSGIGVAMAGLLMALPHTQLSRRLKKEGRLLEEFAPMEQTVDGINYIPKGEMTKRDYLLRYGQMVKELYEPKNFFGRILPALLQLKRRKPPGKVNWKIVLSDLRIFSRHLFYFGLVESEGKWLYWKSLFTILRKNPLALEAFAQDCFFYYHLKRHSKVVQKSLMEYLERPAKGDVLDKRLPSPVSLAQPAVA